MSVDSTNGATSTDTDQTRLLSAYTIEYNAISTRVNAFIALQFVPWPPLAVVLGLVVNAFNGRQFDEVTSAFIAWMTVAAVEVAVFVYLFALFEVYNHIRYVETEVRPKISELIRIDPKWGYERFLEKTGKANDPNYGDRAILLIPLLAILAALYWRWVSGFTVLDVVMLGFNAAGVCGASRMISRVTTARQNMFVKLAA